MIRLDLKKYISIKYINDYRSEIALILVLLLGFETPGKIPNIDYFPQLYTIIIAGVFSWFFLLTKDRKKLISYLKNYFVLVILFSLILLSIFKANHLNFIGSYFFPNSILETLSLIGVAILLARTDVANKIFILYAFVSVVSLYSLISFSKFYFNSRFYGNFLQPDIFGEYLTIGFIAGLQVLEYLKNKKYIILIYINQLFLISLLYLTETRATFLIAIFINLLFIILVDRKRTKYLQTSLLVILLLLFFVSPFRSNSASNLSASSTYRFHLQEVAIPHIRNSILVGSGNQGLQNSILCGEFYKHMDLIQTCREGYYFTSTHNILLDKALVFGILGGLSLLILIIWNIYMKLRDSSNFVITSGLILLSLFLYYFTNVTSLILESILFAFLF